ncbi:MAG: Multidrug resistance protein MdtA [Chroococcopsis gigantea SAG 12.99]|jgi:multidrug efflux system membrane fusion protein|nr:efflux RND transporter periplasmic adaptor subunit [Chlorogloea purpurea SAG 13.99]MDV3001810.1 Multidrug resistance protein MdtA [Chroococcopsis gigantea SAG 12.99]
MILALIENKLLRALTLIYLPFLLNSCNASDARSNDRASKEKPPVPVKIAVVSSRNVPVQILATGNVQAYSTVSVKSQIDGQITGVLFTQGQIVQKGQLLFTIDQRTLKANWSGAIANQAKNRAALQQAIANEDKATADVAGAKAALAKDTIQAQKAAADLKRYTFLQKEGAVSQEQRELYRTNSEALQASIDADRSGIANKQAAVEAARADLQAARAQIEAGQAAIDSAKAQLSYTYIKSPLNGRTGTLNINEGNLVKANDTGNPLVTINQINPIYVSFAVPERYLSQIQQYAHKDKLTVEIQSDQKNTPPQTGKLTFVDSGVNTATGTIILKATFVNSEEKLIPGQLVRVALKLGEDNNAIVVPSAAVQMGQKGQFVFVLDENKTVRVQTVEVGAGQGDNTVITSGLREGDKIVTEGQFNLAPGSKVSVKQ